MGHGSSDVGATVVITHRVRSDKHAEYEAWVDEISPQSRSASGHLDWHLVRPIPGVSETYAVIIRFQTTEHVKNWINSSERRRLIEKVQPLLVGREDFYISSGLDFWFTPAGAKAKVPARWKQYLLTWSAIYPLVLGVPRLVSPALSAIGFSPNVLLDTLAATAVVVYLMVYVVMPRYTRLLRHWLFS
jgi:antibiotic biosynthesis monooxygenase (ABM) superfamily enzyme